MSTTVSYKGQTLATVSNQTKTLLTEGKYLEDDITLVDVSGGGATLITKNISANGTYNASSDSADGYSQVTVAVPASAVDSGTKNITANGNGQDVVGYAAVNVNVPNSYSAGDEGKVVNNGALVAQTSDTVTENDTYDTTLINSLTVNVSGGGGISVDGIAQNTAPDGTVVLANTTTIIGDYAFAYKPIENINAPEVLTMKAAAFNNCKSLKKAIFPKLTNTVNTSNGNQFAGSSVEQLSMPKFSSHNIPGNFANGATRLIVADVGKAPGLQPQVFNNCSALNKVIIRKTDGICALNNTSSLASNTPFKSGGSGGTIYIPEVMFNHLGDGTSNDYQSATNWATIHGYGTITWAKLEGSAYESEAWLSI